MDNISNNWFTNNIKKNKIQSVWRPHVVKINIACNPMYKMTYDF